MTNQQTKKRNHSFLLTKTKVLLIYAVLGMDHKFFEPVGPVLISICVEEVWMAFANFDFII